MKNDTILHITKKEIERGCIPPDCDFAKEIGFTSDKFSGYLWKRGNAILVSLIISREERRGNFLHLLNALKEKGCDIVVPNPSSRMALICDRFGMELIQQKVQKQKKMKCRLKKRSWNL